MSQTSVSLEASYAFCRHTARGAGSNFTPCFWVLPRSKRRAMEVLYAFMRHTDDLADNPQPVSQRREALVRWRAALDGALSGRETTWGPSQLSRSDNGTVPFGKPDDPPGLALLPALADTVRTFAIPREHLQAVIQGVEMDLARQSYETFEELAEYCRRVASAVGLACLYIWGFRGPEAFEPAIACGVAVQLTNILRDLREDAQQGRIYLPREDLHACNYAPEDLLRGVVDKRLRQVVELEADRAERLYRQGAALANYLEADGRRVFGMMMSVYHGLLRRIRRRPEQVLLRRIRLPWWEKLAIAARWSLGPPAFSRQVSSTSDQPPAARGLQQNER